MKLSKVISKLEEKGLHITAENVKRIIKGALQVLSRYPNIFKFCMLIHLDNNTEYRPRKGDEIANKFTQSQLKKAEKFLKSLSPDELETFATGDEVTIKRISRKAAGGREAHIIGDAFFNDEFLEKQVG